MTDFNIDGFFDYSVLCEINIYEGVEAPGFCRCGYFGPIPALAGMTRDGGGKIICYWVLRYYCTSPCNPFCPGYVVV